MISAADIASDMDAGLKQLFDAGLELALQVQANAMAAEPEEQARLSLTFHRLSRSVRQTAALRMRIAREAERSGRQTAAEVVSLHAARVERRKAQVTAQVSRLLWTEADGPDDYEALQTDLERFLAIEVLDEAFPTEDPDTQIARILQAIELPSPPTPTTVTPRSGVTPDPGDPSGVASSSPQPGSPASPGGRTEDDAESDDGDDYWRASG